jgi:Helix-turn-helix domain
MQYYTGAEAADYLGIKLAYLRRQMRMGHGPAHYRSSPRLALFEKNDLDQWRACWQRIEGNSTQGHQIECVKRDPAMRLPQPSKPILGEIER